MLVSLAWLGPALLAAIDAVAQQHIWRESPDLRAALFGSIDWLLYALFTPAVFLLARRWPIRRPQLSGRVLVHVVCSIAFSAAWAGAGTMLKLVLQPQAMKDGIARFAVSWFFTTLPFGCAVYLSMVGIEHAVYYFAEARDRELQVARLSEQLSDARLSALKAQLNPHFLFNSLNTIAVLARDGESARAAIVIEQLSDVLRHTLERAQDNEVTLGEELELARQYLAVESARFSDRLRPTFAIAPDTVAALVPSFALQHLVENAVRHGIGKRSDAGTLAISARRDGEVLTLVVSDDGPGIAHDAGAAAGHGIANTRERLRTLYGRIGTLDVRRGQHGGTIATLSVPFHLDAARALTVDD